LPTGVTLTDNGNGTATLAGTPGFNTNGTYNVTIQTDNAISPAATQNFTLTVSPASILVVDSTGDTAVAADCAVQTDPTQNTGNSSCTLRDALAKAQSLGAANIYFYPPNFASAASLPVTISLSNGTLVIPASTAIFGPGSGVVTVQGGGTASVFSLAGGLSASIDGMEITGGGGSAGGGIKTAGTLKVTNSTFANNQATLSGGAIYDDTGASTTVINSTFYSNSASNASGGGGGAIFNVGGANLSVADSTFTNNTSTSTAGGAIYNQAGSGQSVSVVNSIVSGNLRAASTPDDVYDASNILTDIPGNVFGVLNGTATGSPAINLAPLANYGGSALTMLPQPGSPAICAGSTQFFPTNLTTDQRGLPNSNTTYPGHDAGNPPCVDAGAVQTAYAMSFTTNPPATFNSGDVMSPSPVVTLTESGTTATSATGTVTVADSAAKLTGTASVNLASGTATYSDLSTSAPVSGDKLTATLALTSTINLTADSGLFTSLGQPALGLAISHRGTFIQGQTAEWDVTVSNGASSRPTFGVTQVIDTLPTGYSLAGYNSVDGWSCTPSGVTISCSLSGSIATGGSSTIVLTVNVPADSPTQVTNTAEVFGGGDPVHTAPGSALTVSDINVPVQQVAATISPNGSSLSATVFSNYSSLAVTVYDAAGVPVPGVNVVFTAPASGASGTFASNNTNTTTITTDSNGAADPGTFTANTVAGSYQLTAQAGAASSSFNMNNTPGALSQILLSTPPHAFTTWPIWVTVAPEDQYGNLVPNFNDSLHITSTDTTADLPPDGPLCGCNQFQVTFNTAGSQTVTVQDTTSSLTVTSDPIIVSAPPNLVVTNNGDGPADDTQCNPEAAPGVGSGTTCTLRDALNAASSWEAGNITFDTSKLGSTPTITLSNGVLEIPNDTRITGPSGAAPVVTVSGNNLTRVFQITNPSNQGAIDSIAITGGSLTDAAPNAVVSGAAIYNNGTLWVDNVVISGNTASATDNTGEVDGGAIYTDNDLEISNSTITGNTTSAGGSAFGAGIFNTSYVNASNLTITNNTATSLTAIAAGGGILNGLNGPAELDMDHSTISGNKAQGPTDNSGDAAGGGIASVGGSDWITYSTFAGNSVTGATGFGGGAYYCLCGQELENVTIAGGNSSNTVGGGLMVDSSGVSTPSNSIIAGNTAPSSPDVIGTFSSFGNNVIGDGTGATGLANGANGDQVGSSAAPINALLGALANNGGPLQTMLPLPGSPAICNGLFPNIPPGETLDERGFPNVNITYPGFSAKNQCVDAGAVQTNYTMTFSSEPAPISPATTFNVNVPFQAAVTLNESGIGTNGITVPLLLRGPGVLSGGSAVTAGGIATYSALKTNRGGPTDVLEAALPLNSTLSPALVLRVRSSAFLVHGPPYGWIDQIVDARNGSTTISQSDNFVVSGWAASPQGGAPVTSVKILIDGKPAGFATLGILRGDVESALYTDSYAHSGWSFSGSTAGLTVGPHTVSAIVTDSLNLSVTLPAQTFSVAVSSIGPPIGWIDLAVNTLTRSKYLTPADTLLVVGWAADPQDGSPVTSVQILIDGNPAGSATRGLLRRDVAAAYGKPAYNNSGWTFSLPAVSLSYGTHTVSAIATNTASLSTTLTTTTITVVATNPDLPLGWIDQVMDATTHSSTTVSQADNLLVTGWAADPVDGAPVTAVRILVDRAFVGNATLGLPRHDVAAHYSNPAYTNSGWTFTTPASAFTLGTHTITAVVCDSRNLTTSVRTIVITVTP
jgi:hypothetical protein